MPHLTAMTTARRRSAMVLAAVLAIPTPELATIFTWDGGSGVNNNFSSGFNWNPSSAPLLLGLSTSDLVFASALRTSPNAEAAYQVNSITFAVNAASFNITGAATLTLNYSGITQNSSNTQTISAPLDIAASPNTSNWTISASNLTVNGAVKLTNDVLFLNVAANRTVTFSGAISGTGTFLSQNGGGRTVISNSVASDVGLSVLQGTMEVATGGSATGGSAPGGATVNSNGTLLISGGTVGTTSLGANVEGRIELASGTHRSSTFNLGAGSSSASISQSGGSLQSTTINIGNPTGSGDFNSWSYSISAKTLGTTNLIVGVSAIGISSFNQSGGTATVSGSVILGNAAGSSGLSSVSNGSFNLAGTRFYVGNVGNGRLTLSGAAVVSAPAVTLRVGNDDQATGTVILFGNASLISATLNVGHFRSGTFSQSGGTNTTRNLNIGLNSNSSGRCPLAGGNLQTTNTFVGVSGAGNFSQSGGTHTATGSIIVGQNVASATYTLSGGAVSTQFLTVGDGDFSVSANGAFIQSGGSASATELKLELGSGNTASYALSSGTLGTSKSMIGLSGDGSFALSGGTHNATALQLGVGSFGTGVYLMSGGTLSTNQTTVGVSGNANFTQTGGLHTSLFSLVLANNSSSLATCRLSGGVLQVPTVGGFAGVPTFLFDGGTLRPTATTASLFNFFSSQISAGGAIIDTRAFNITLTTPVVTDPIIPTTDGGVKKIGTGTLTLSASNTYTGPTAVDAGILSVPFNAALGNASTPVVINPGARLSFSGSTTTSRAFQLFSGTIQTAPATTLTFSGATVSGGQISSSGRYNLTNNTALNAVTTLPGSQLLLTSGAATLNAVILRGSLTKSSGTSLALPDIWFTPSANVVLAGPATTSALLSEGSLVLSSSATLTNSGSNITFSSGSRTTISSGATLVGGPGVDLLGLLVNNGTQSGPLNVLYGGLAKGAGTFGSISIGDGGTFSPGNSPAAVTSESSTRSPGGNYTVELLDALGTPGNGFDQWNINGDLLISSGLTLNSIFTVSLVSLSPTSTAGLASNFIPGRPYLWPIATISGSVTGFDPAKLNLDLSAFANPTFQGTFALTLPNPAAPCAKTLFLACTPPAIPEPAHLALLPLAALPLLRRRR